MSSNLSTDDIEMALSLGVDPDDSGPLSDARRRELEALVSQGAEAEADHEQAVGAAVGQDAIAAAAEQIMAKLAAAAGGGSPATSMSVAQGSRGLTLEEVLKQIDPRDSEAALLLLEWLTATGRLQNIGSINGGGYIWHYSEPKGTTKAGYTPGGTKGGRMVDQALDNAKASGAKPAKRGMCDKCWSAVRQEDDGTTITDDEAASAECAGGGTHNFNA